MSEQEKRSGSSVTPAPLVVVEQTPATRHKPIHPTELHDEPADVQRKHSRAPVVEPLAEESNSASQDIKESDCAKSRDKPKQTLSKKFSSITNMSKKFSNITSKRGPSMETITLAPVDIESKREAPSSHQQPIPASVEIVASHSDNLLEVKQESTVEKKGDDDSITEEITDLRTSEAAKKHSEWANGGGDITRPKEGNAELAQNYKIASSSAIKRKEISWEHPEYLDKVHVMDMGVKNQVCMLEGKTSIGPCLKDLAPNNGPSGIFICIPKKGPKFVRADFKPIPSVVNINVSKKRYPKKSKSQLNHSEKTKKPVDIGNDDLKPECSHPKSFGTFGGVRSKLENFTSKIINVFNI